MNFNYFNNREEYWNEIEKDRFLEETFTPRIKKDMEIFFYSTIVNESHLQNNNLYLTGYFGTGKTLYAAKLALLQKEKYFKAGQNFRVEFIKSGEIAMFLQNIIKDPDDFYCFSSRKEMWDYYANCDLLIYDDFIGTNAAKEADTMMNELHSIQFQHDLLCRRSNDKEKQTIVTSILSLNDEVFIQELKNDYRVYSPLIKNFELVEFEKIKSEAMKDFYYNIDRSTNIRDFL